MVRFLKLFCWLAVLTLSVDRAGAFVLKGPFETYQTTPIGYVGGDLGGPHNLNEEYRRNTPTIYYTFDKTFTDYFGTNGVQAIEEAFAILNSVTNVSSYSADLFEWPLEAQSFNFKAQALNLTDLKSEFLAGLMEQMGLMEAERFVWALHDRQVGPGGCPANVSYFVDKMNFDPIFTPLDTLQVSSYVNGTLYTYFIDEICTGAPVLADAIEVPVNPNDNSFTAVSGQNVLVGSYYTGLTRDDVGGLRFLLRTNNLNIETPGDTTITAFTNTSVTQLLFTSNLTLLVNQALTNSAAALQALYPDLVIGSTTPIFTNLVTTNIITYFTNFPWSPAGAPATLVFATNRTTNVTTWFNHQFLNVVTNTYYTKGWITVLTTNISGISCGPGAPAGLICTNVTTHRVFTNFINGDYYIIPTNSACGVSIIHTQLTSVLTLTNDAVIATNAPGTTNVANQFFSQSLIFYFTNRAFIINPVPCLVGTNALEQRQGIEHVQFIRYDGGYDTISDTYGFPFTNQYQLISVPITNPVPTPRTIFRSVRRPDFVITAMDLVSEQGVPVRGGTFAITGFIFADYSRNLPFNTAGQLPGKYGPGTIEPNLVFTFNDIGPLFLNFTPFNLDELTQQPLLAWGSFDGSTNAPVVYPNGTSIVNYENNTMIKVEPPYLPEGFLTTTVLHTNFYKATLSLTSFTPTFTPPVSWGMAPGSPSLPTGLSISTTSTTNGVISGFPTTTGTFDFTLRLTDNQGRTTDRTYFIKINP